MIRNAKPLTFAKARSRLAFWLLAAACCLGVVCWFLVANRAPVEVILPFGFGTHNGPIAVVIFVSMAIGAFWVIALQALLKARRHLRELYRRWSLPRTDPGHRYEPPHIVSRSATPMLTGYANRPENSDQAS
jgi:hypothetical protein